MSDIRTPKEIFLELISEQYRELIRDVYVHLTVYQDEYTTEVYETILEIYYPLKLESYFYDPDTVEEIVEVGRDLNVTKVAFYPLEDFIEETEDPRKKLELQYLLE